MLGGDRLALARLITLLENRSGAVPEIMRGVHARAQRGYVVGVTGPPGAGKSTVVDRLTAALRAEGQTVGIVAVDPSSPFTGGAVLGDRIRMQGHALDSGVFIRSMATRGAFGGMARATSQVIKLLAAFGFDWTRGRQDKSTHPFAISMGSDDVRMTTRYASRITSCTANVVHHGAARSAGRMAASATPAPFAISVDFLGGPGQRIKRPATHAAVRKKLIFCP